MEGMPRAVCTERICAELGRQCSQFSSVIKVLVSSKSVNLLIYVYSQVVPERAGERNVVIASRFAKTNKRTGSIEY